MLSDADGGAGMQRLARAPRSDRRSRAAGPGVEGQLVGGIHPPLTDTLDGFAQVAGEYQSSLYYVAADPQTFQPGFAIFDLHLGVRSHDKRWDVTAFVNNLFDQQYYASLVNTAGNFAGRMATQAVLPRDFRRYAGVRFGVNF